MTAIQPRPGTVCRATDEEGRCTAEQAVGDLCMKHDRRFKRHGSFFRYQPKTLEDAQTVTFKIEGGPLAELRAMAEARHVSLGQVLRDAVEHFLEGAGE